MLRIQHKTLLTIIAVMVFYSAPAQTGEAIIEELKTANKNVVDKACTASNAAAITNRAMNVFLADKTAYLSHSSDLSYYTNYISFNSTEGRLTVNHNFQKATGKDEQIKKLFSAGISLNAANAITPDIVNRKFEKEAGFLLGYKWLGKVKTTFSDCNKITNSSHQKQSMDALRAGLLSTLQSELIDKETAFLKGLKTIDTTAIPGQNIDSAKATMLPEFYETLQAEYTEQFVTLQAAMLTKTRNYKLIRTGWTSLSSYLPVVSPYYTVATSINLPFQQKRSYPLAVTLSHTGLWESTKTGRWFVTLSGNAFFNNSKRSNHLSTINLSQYQTLGGIDTFYTTDLKNNNAYLGTYKNFVTPSLQGRLVYFPPANSHVGISLYLEQNFGSYHLLNSKIGIPVILINSKKLPAVNIEFYVQFFDISGSIKTNDRSSTKLVGLNMGIPLSRLMY